MKFVKFTEPKSGAVYVNPQMISRFRATSNGSWIALLDTDSIYVTEDVETILKKLHDISL